MYTFPHHAREAPAQPSTVYAHNGAQLGFVDVNQLHTAQLDTRSANHGQVPFLHPADVPSGRPRGAPDHLQYVQAPSAGHAHQIGAEQVLTTRPPGEPPPHVTHPSDPPDFGFTEPVHPVLSTSEFGMPQSAPHAPLPLPAPPVSAGYLRQMQADVPPDISTAMRHNHPPPDVFMDRVQLANSMVSGVRAEGSPRRWHSPDHSHAPVAPHELPFDPVKHESMCIQVTADAAPVQWFQTSSLPMGQIRAPLQQEHHQLPDQSMELGYDVHHSDVRPSDPQHVEGNCGVRGWYTTSHVVEGSTWHAPRELPRQPMSSFLPPPPSVVAQEDYDAADSLLAELDAGLGDVSPRPHRSADRIGGHTEPCRPAARADSSPHVIPALETVYASQTEVQDFVCEAVTRSESLPQCWDASGPFLPGDSSEHQRSHQERDHPRSPSVDHQRPTSATPSSRSNSPASSEAFRTPERDAGQHHSEHAKPTRDSNSRSRTPSSPESRSDAESGEIVDSGSESPGRSAHPPAPPPGPISFMLAAQQPEPCALPAPRSTPLRSMFLCPDSDDHAPEHHDPSGSAGACGTPASCSAVAPSLADSNNGATHGSPPVAIGLATAQVPLPAPGPTDTSDHVVHAFERAPYTVLRRAAQGSERTAAAHASARPSAPRSSFAPLVVRHKQTTKAIARRSLSPSVDVRSMDRGRSQHRSDNAPARTRDHDRMQHTERGIRSARGSARERRSDDSRYKRRPTSRKASPILPVIGGAKRSRDKSSGDDEPVPQAPGQTPRQRAAPASPPGVRTAEHSVPLESTENPVAKKEQEPPLDTATDGLEPPSALSDMRESLLQQLKKRKQRAAEEPLDLAKGSPEAIAFTGQRKAADAVAPVDVLTSDALVRDTGDRSTVAWKAVGGSAEDEVFHRVSQRSPQAQCSKDEKDTKLVCLEFCQCVCLSEEPVVSHTHIDIGVPVMGRCSLDEGECTGVHDPSLVVPCPGFASAGLCKRPGCRLQHKVVPNLMPMCTFFFKGHCRNGDSCMYVHQANVAPRAPVCPDFLRGFCPDGKHCTMKHFTQRTLMDYYMRPQDYETMISVAEETWARCEPASDLGECEAPSPSQQAHDITVNAQGPPDEKTGSLEARAVVQDEEAGRHANGVECMSAATEDGGPGGVVQAAAEYIRSTAAHGGLHIGGVNFPSLVAEG